ncbi:TatD family hydrolase [Shewanella youngdeokensis]|uniref:TatD family hydrolase n=1 Tax=Shewanella youngdeokensis TaxID=2999068 RepID=A0ABZ0K0E5_9GAMM|nr:TatD family hydrolase [Shewanella sp. DAU334]
MAITEQNAMCNTKHASLHLIDSHAHLDFPEFDHDRELLFEKMSLAGITQVLVPGVSEDRWDNQIQIANKFECLFSLGIHPWYCDLTTDSWLSNLRQRLTTLQQSPRLVAIGECGLDKLHKSNFYTQLSVFQVHMELAKEFDLPLIIHCVKSHQEMLKCLKEANNPKAGVIHGFSGSPELAMQYVNLGYKLGVGGLVLNDNASKLQQTISLLPSTAFVLETDSPAMCPKSINDGRNTPLILPLLVDKMAKLQNISNVLMGERLRMNVSQLFDL